jgi:hypothetical protein
MTLEVGAVGGQANRPSNHRLILLRSLTRPSAIAPEPEIHSSGASAPPFILSSN